MKPDELEYHSRLYNACWRSTKIAYGCVRHVTSHTPGDEDLLHLTWEEMPEVDRQFDRDVMKRYRSAILGTEWELQRWNHLDSGCVGFLLGAIVVLLAWWGGR